MNVARSALRKERLFRDRLNPLEVYDEVEIKDLSHFERANILAITDNLHDRLQHAAGLCSFANVYVYVCEILCAQKFL